jgi:hypothetical protein
MDVKGGDLASELTCGDAGDPVVAVDDVEGTVRSPKLHRLCDQVVEMRQKAIRVTVARRPDCQSLDRASRPELFVRSLVGRISPREERDEPASTHEVGAEVQHEQVSTTNPFVSRRVERIVDESEHEHAHADNL